MSSLQAHLERHDVAAGTLEFRRDCFLCRAERVHGRLPSPSLIPGRAPAAMAATVLAASSVAPGAAVAADGQGVAAPAPTAPPPPQGSELTVGEGGAAPVERDHDAGSGAADARGQDSGGADPSERRPEPDAGAHDAGPGGGKGSDSRLSPTHDDGATAGSGDARTLPLAVAIAAVSTIGYLGSFVAPPVIGGIAQATGVSTALLALVAGSAVLGALAGPALAPSHVTVEERLGRAYPQR